MRIGFLGIGSMGKPMALRLLAAGHELTVWNRTRGPHRSRCSEKAPSRPAPQQKPSSVADVVITMLFDDAAHEDVLFGPNGAHRRAVKPGALHISCSTISVALSESLTAEHARRGQRYVAAPVFGRPNIAEDGRLWTVVAGEDAAIAESAPAARNLLARHLVVGNEPRQAHALKLGGNFLISAMIHRLSEAFVFAESQGIEPQVFLEAINNALFQSPFYAAYGKVMLNPPRTPGATSNWAPKIIACCAKPRQAANTRLSLADTLAQVFAQAQQAGLGGEDWAVGQYRMAQRRGRAGDALT